MSMTTSHVPVLLSSSLAWTWLVVYGAIFLSHARCIVAGVDSYRLWHTAHCVMAIAMADMFVPGGGVLASAAVWQALFLVLTVVSLFRVVGSATGYGPRRFVWAVTGIDMAAMAYMMMPPAGASPLISYALGGYFVLEACTWAAGRIALDDVRRPAMVGVAGYETAWTADNQSKSGRIACPVEHRVALGVMSAGMAYMFMAMPGGM